MAFFRDLIARGLSGVKLVTSDAPPGLVDAVGATLPGTSWQRCRTHFAANLMSYTPSTPGARSKRCCTRSTTSPTPTRCTPSSTASWPTSPSSCPTWRTTSTPPEPTSGVHRLPERHLAPNLVEQPQRAAQPRNPAPNRRRGASSRPRLRSQADRCGARRAARRMGRITTLHRPGNSGTKSRPHYNRRRNRAKHRKRPDKLPLSAPRIGTPEEQRTTSSYTTPADLTWDFGRLPLVT